MRCPLLLATAAFIAAGLMAPAVVWSQATADAPAGENRALEVLYACSDSVDQEVTGFPDMETACPGVEQAIADAGYSPFVSDSQRAELTGDSIFDLHSLAERYETPPRESTKSPDPASLSTILESLQKDEQVEAPLTWFQKLTRWFRERVTRQQGDDSWLARWLEGVQIKPSIAEMIVYASILTIIVLALAVLVNELRVAGVFRRQPAGSKRKGRSASASPDASATFIDLDHAAPADRPSILLRMLVAALVRNGRLAAERSLTHRELTVRAAFDDEAHRKSFHNVAMLAERAVYGGALSAPDADPIIAAGRELHASLSARAS